ncbi:MAG: Holliday junction branch migration protein RuvA, partial [Clostridia bacterium]|nr:Holliday junction branch migration protein RuvA [Clostridia bacterium]
MFYSLTGKVVMKDSSSAAIDCSGVAYLVNTTLSTINSLPPVGETATVYTYLAVREDALDLFGFYSKDELECFKLLITVSGVGPKAATAVLSALTPSQLAVAISSGDVKAITAAQGVGAKIAQRIVLELRSKMGSLEMSSDNLSSVADAAKSGISSASKDAVDALVSAFGYSRSEASIAVGRLDQNLSTEEMIRKALSVLA